MVCKLLIGKMYSCTHASQKQGGFTLLELILVTATLLLLFSAGGGFYSRFFNQNAVGNATDQLVNEFRKAQMYAMTGYQGSNWGIDFAANTITLYNGVSYATRNTAFSETFTVPASVTITGLNDINFSRVTGTPSAAAIITISSTGETKTLTLNAQGMITR